MFELGDRARLAQEPLRKGAGRSDLQVQDLHRDIPVESVVASPEHGREATLPEQRTDGKFLPLGSQRRL